MLRVFKPTASPRWPARRPSINTHQPEIIFQMRSFFGESLPAWPSPHVFFFTQTSAVFLRFSLLGPNYRRHCTRIIVLSLRNPKLPDTQPERGNVNGFLRVWPWCFPVRCFQSRLIAAVGALVRAVRGLCLSCLCFTWNGAKTWLVLVWRQMYWKASNCSESEIIFFCLLVHKEVSIKIHLKSPKK